MFTERINQAKALLEKLNRLGFPIITARDPKTGRGSISLTLVFISSLLVIVGIVGKWSGKLGGIDMTYAMEFLWTSCSLYFGRQMQSSGKSVTMDAPATQKAEESDR